MDNVSKEKQAAKQACLDKQSNAMLALFQKADNSERVAIIRAIDGFLPNLSGDEKSFWLKFRQKLERLAERSNGIKPGKCTMDCGAASDYDDKYCWTCVERMIEDREGDIQGGNDNETGDDPIFEDVPF